LVRLMKSRTRTIIVLALIILVISFPGIASTVKAATQENDWTARTFFHARPASKAGLDPLTPSQIIGAYNLGSATGGAGTTIAIVDAFDDPTIASDLAYFSNYFSLPTASFVKYKMATTIPVDSGWALEISLDVEWAHAIAQKATILLVEARSNSLSDLLSAVSYATTYPGVKAVSMSWGGSEFSTETFYDSYFNNAGITFFASSGDSGAGVIWPSSSLYVVAVGGTTLNLANGVVTSETAWSGSGGGVSAYEPKPGYQTSYGLIYARRAVPDVSYDANPNTGVLVYDSTPYQGFSGWWVVGGTSVGAPQWAAIQALGLSANNNNFYQDAKSASYSSYFRDITVGSNGYPATTGYDLVTGLGSPLTTNYAPITTPDYSISVSPSALTINAGASGSSTITVTSLNGFSGTVTLAAAAPNGWSASPIPSSLMVSSGGSASSTLTITVPSNAAAGKYPVTVTGTSSSLSHTTTITVQATSPDFSISASPTSLRVRSGSSGTSTITVTSLNGFTGQVTLSTNAPTGWTTSFSKNPIQTSGTSTLTITVPTGTRSGSYTVTVKGTSGTLSHTTTITVSVSRNQGQQ
jgi:subtilase family serine protease